MDKYGPFTNIVAISLALVTTFSLLLLKTVGQVTKWTWLTSGSPPFLVVTGARVIAFAFMATTYIVINRSNYSWFGIFVLLTVALFVYALINFDYLRKIHTVQIPLVDLNGNQSMDKKGKPLSENIVIGTESQMLPDVKRIFDSAKKKTPGLSLSQFMAGFGTVKSNDPEAIWSREVLAEISNKLFMFLILIFLSAVMVLYLSAFIIEVFNR
jgi:hypothetical protein